jgi:hypothetical protein
MLACKLAAIPQEYPVLLQRWPEFGSAAALDSYLAERGLKIEVWSGQDVDLDYQRAGLAGSPTKVLNVEYVVLGGSDSREVEASREGLAALVRELVQEYAL